MTSTPATTTGQLTALVTQLLAFNASRLHAYDKTFATPRARDKEQIDDRRVKLRDFLTVGTLASRQSGKTGCIVNMIGPNDLAVFHNLDISRAIYERYMHERGSALRPPERADATHFVTAHSIKHLFRETKKDDEPDPSLRGVAMKTLRRVWVDDATFIFDEIIDRKRFYRWLAKNTQGDLEIIMLG